MKKKTITKKAGAASPEPTLFVRPFNRKTEYEKALERHNENMTLMAEADVTASLLARKKHSTRKKSASSALCVS